MKVSITKDIDVDYIYLKVNGLKPRAEVTKHIRTIAKMILGLKTTEEGWYLFDERCIEDWICRELVTDGYAYYREI